MKTLPNIINNTAKYFIPIILLAGVWLNINTGFWSFDAWDTGLWGKLYAMRATMPYLLSCFGLACYFFQKRQFRSAANPVWWLMIYGYLTLFASIFSPNIYASSYWGLAYMMGIFIPAVFFCGQDGGNSATVPPENVMLYTTWAILAIFLAGMIYTFGNAIISRREILVVSGTMQPDVMIRSSGLSRFFGIAGIIITVWILQCKSAWRFLLAFPLVYCAAVVYRAQSRGAMLAFAFSFLLLLLLSRIKWVAMMLFIFALCFSLLLYSLVTRQLEESVVKQFRRGETNEQLVSMSGRVRAYRAGLKQIEKNPILGRGNWTDRMVIGEHVHNSYLQAAMNGGLLSLVPYFLSWLVGWLLFIYIYPRRRMLSDAQMVLLLQSFGVMVFFFVRSIPETTTASFSVDLVVMVPVYYFLCAVYHKVRSKKYEGISKD